jgi:hypothetical protein
MGVEQFGGLESLEDTLLCFREKQVTPVNGGTERLLAGQCGTVSAGPETEALVKAPLVAGE